MSDAVPRSFRAQAVDPTTPPQTLRVLAANQFGREVAGNPNTPVDLLLKLAGRYFEEFSTNPVLPLLLLEDPGLGARMPAATLRRLLRRVDVPAHFLQTLERHADEEVRDAVRWHCARPAAEGPPPAVVFPQMSLPTQYLGDLLDLEAVPEWLLETLCGAESQALRDDALKVLSRVAPERFALFRRTGAASPPLRGWSSVDPGLTAEELAGLAAAGPWIRRMVAGHPNTPPETLRRLVAAPDSRTWRRALEHPAVPVELLWSSASVPDVKTRVAVAGNLSAPPALLDQLGYDAQPRVRSAVGRHPWAEEATLLRLAGDASGQVQETVAGNLRVPPPVLARLAVSSFATVREKVARHRALTPELCERLALDAEPRVRAALARRGLTKELIVRFLGDPEKRVRDAASHARTLPLGFKIQVWRIASAEEATALLAAWEPRRRRARALPPPLPRTSVKQRYGREQFEMADYERGDPARYPQIPPGDLVVLARDRNRHVREAVARNAAAPLEALEMLATDVDVQVRDMVAMHKTAPPELLTKMAEDRHKRVREIVAYHQNTPVEVLVRLARDRAAAVRQSAAMAKRLPIEELARLAEDEEPAVRRAVGQNPATPETILRQLFAAVGTDEGRIRLAYNDALPADLLARLAQSPNAEVRAAVARNESLPIEVQRQLATDVDARVRDAMASYGKPASDIAVFLLQDPVQGIARAAWSHVTDADMLTTLANEPDPERRSLAAGNEHLPLEVLQRLTRDPVAAVRDCAFLSRRLSLAERLALANEYPGERIGKYHGHWLRQLTDEDWSRWLVVAPEAVRCALASGENTPRAVLEKLAADPSEAVRAALRTHKFPPLAVLREMAAGATPQVRYEIARNWFVPIDLLEELAQAATTSDYHDTLLQLLVARHPRMSAEALTRFAAREIERRGRKGIWPSRRRYRRRRWLISSFDVIVALIARPEIPVGTFEPLLGIPLSEVRRALLTRVDLPPEWRQRLLRGILGKAVAQRSLFGRTCALAHGSTPEGQLAAAVRRGRWLERYAVARNPAASAPLIEELARDSNVLVRAAARARLEAARSAPVSAE